MQKKKTGWREYPAERPEAEGYYLVITRKDGRAACYWNGLSWEYDIIGTGMRAYVRAQDVKLFKEWEDEGDV